MKQIHIDIDTDAAIRIDAVGFTGTECDAATKFLEEALGKV